MRVTIAACLLLTACASSHDAAQQNADPYRTDILVGVGSDPWCDSAKDKAACLEFSGPDHSECRDFQGLSYSNCRQHLAAMRQITDTTPPGGSMPFGHAAIDTAGREKPYVNTPEYAEVEAIRPETEGGRERLLALAGEGNPLAMVLLAGVYADGNGVTKDCSLARYWLTQADAAIPAWDASDSDKAELRGGLAYMLPKICEA